MALPGMTQFPIYKNVAQIIAGFADLSDLRKNVPPYFQFNVNGSAGEILARQQGGVIH